VTRPFNPCQGRDLCTEEETHCHGCGRSHGEIAATRALIDALADLSLEQGYTNPEDFLQYVAEKALKKIRARR